MPNATTIRRTFIGRPDGPPEVSRTFAAPGRAYCMATRLAGHTHAPCTMPAVAGTNRCRLHGGLSLKH